MRELSESRQVDKRHGRLEVRPLTSTTTLNKHVRWPGVGLVFRVVSETKRSGKQTREVRYFMTSLTRGEANARRLLAIVRELHSQGTSILLVEQSVNVALSVASRAYFLEKGVVRFEGPSADLLGRTDLLRAVFLDGAAPVPVSTPTTREHGLTKGTPAG